MATRCMVIIKKANKSIMLYHHFDGYPSGVGCYLMDKYYHLLDKSKDGLCFPSIDYIANELVKDKYDEGYEISSCMHTDIEYEYVINLEKFSISCYERDFIRVGEGEDYGFKNVRGKKFNLYKIWKNRIDNDAK